MQGLIELKKVGVYAGILIKKRMYWPKHVLGDMIDKYFDNKDVVETDSLHGELDGIQYNISCMKEPQYVTKIMATYSGLIVKEGQKESIRKYVRDDENKEISFKYTTPFSNHFDYRHVVDDHNNLRH